jgi:hypothetical protein
MLYWILSSEDPEIREKLSDDHKLWIKDQLASIAIATLQTVLSEAEKISSNPRILGSYLPHIQKELRTYRTPKTVQIPEPRRIGVGYRDKGSLRPSHKRGRDHGEIVFWSEDLPVTFPEKFDPRYITAEEVCSLGTNLEHLRIWEQILTYNREAPTLLSASQ